MWTSLGRSSLFTRIYLCDTRVNCRIKTNIKRPYSLRDKACHVCSLSYQKFHDSVLSLYGITYELLGKTSQSSHRNPYDSVLNILFSDTSAITEFPLFGKLNICNTIGEIIRICCCQVPNSDKQDFIEVAQYISITTNCILYDNSPINENYFGAMSLNESISVERVNPGDSESLEDNDDEVCIVFEKLISKNPEQSENNAEDSMNNESEREDKVKYDTSCQDYTAYLKKPTTECVKNPHTFLGSPQHVAPSKVLNKRSRLREFRQWEYTNFGRDFIHSGEEKKNILPFTIMSYNVLAQSLLENHPYLYYNHNRAALSWEWRSKALMEEIEAISPDILCLQEVQESHLESFYYPQLLKLGYNGLYKKRTGDKPDGVAIYYKVSVFSVEEFSTVEFMQPIMPVLNRDNVALIARFSSKLNPSMPHLCVATTHLLYNPKRMDVKLAQIQLLLAELERLAFVGNKQSPSYYPLIVTGDLNVTPKSSLYRLLTTGILLDNDVTDEMLDVLGITSNCQHFNILSGRQDSNTSTIDRLSELIKLKVYNSDHVEILSKIEVSSVNQEGAQELKFERKKGHLSHSFILKSAYEHRNSRGKEVTTKQDKWVTVDYIFYSCLERDLNLEPIEGKLKLICRKGLLCKEECFAYGPIPNLGSPSDHFPLVCKFVLML